MAEDRSMTEAELDRYFARINYAGPTDADVATLGAIQAAHLTAIPFENIDTQLGHPPGLDPDAIFAKLVEGRRGGWCYEMNGLFGRALATLGFAVTRLGGAVRRAHDGDQSFASHLALRVDIDGEPWLADAGFAGLLWQPAPLREGRAGHAPLPGGISRTGDGFWRFEVEGAGMPMYYDFADAPADEARFAELCHWQATAPQSVFVQNLTVQRRAEREHVALRGKVLTRLTPGQSDQRELASADELVTVLADEFGLDVPEVASLWPAIEERHAALFGANLA
jgi:N-hydroxyarylamine O-acetyltransferase